MINRFVMIVALAILVTASLLASPVQAITLQEAVDMAVSKSEGAGMVLDQAGAMRAGARAEAAELLPHLRLDAGYYKMGTDAEPSPFFVSPERQYEATLSAAQLLWGGGRVTKGFRLKGTRLSQADLSERMGLSAVRYKVAVMYYGVLFQEARAGVLRDRVEQCIQELSDARALRETGLAAALDVRHAALSLAMARDDLLAGELDYRQALLDFNVEIGNGSLDEAGLMEPEGELGRAVGLADMLESIRREFQEGSLPEIRMSGLSLREAELKRGIAWGRYFPSLSLVASAESSGQETALMDNSWVAGLNMKFDFYDGGLRGALNSGARAEESRARRDASRTRKLVDARVRSMLMRVASVDGRIELRAEAVDLAERNYEDARAEYRAGLSTLTRLGEFNLVQAEARLGLLGLYFEEQKLMAEAVMLMGRPR